MKLIDLAEAKSNLERYARECRETPVVVSIDGQPAFELSPVFCDEDDDFINRLVEHNRDFQELLQQRDEEKQRGETIPYDEVRRQLLGDGP